MSFTENELQDSAFSFFKEANSVLGVDVPSMVLSKGIEIQYVGECQVWGDLHSLLSARPLPLIRSGGTYTAFHQPDRRRS